MLQSSLTLEPLAAAAEQALGLGDPPQGGTSVEKILGKGAKTIDGAVWPIVWDIPVTFRTLPLVCYRDGAKSSKRDRLTSSGR